MPQSTLSAYFQPLQLESVKNLNKHIPRHVEPRNAASSPGVIATQELDSSVMTQQKQAVAESIRDIIPSNTFNDSILDVYRPPGQPYATIIKVIPAHLTRLKSITGTLLPVRYPDKFFNECIEDDGVADLSRVLLWNSQPVGWVRCRLEESEHGDKQIYIQALGVLAPYRGYGLATNLLEQIMQPVLLVKYKPTSIYCHVWCENESALEWYEKKGFRRVVLLEGYYRRLKPAAAWIMRKDFG